MENELVKFSISFLPILWLVVSLGKLKMQAYRASIIAFVSSIVIAAIFYKMYVGAIIQASIEGMMLAIFPILWVIVSALFVYNTSLKTGGMEKIKSMLSGLSCDRRVQGLILAFAFGGFLESVAGFGTAVAIPAAILVAMGFSPILASTVCLIANTIPVAFGVLGVPIITLAQVTSLPLGQLSLYTALQLFPLAVFLPLFLVFAITGSIKGIKGVVGVSITAGIVFATTQTLVAFYIGPEIAAVAGSLAALAGIVLFIKRFPTKNVWLFDGEKHEDIQPSGKIHMFDALKAWSPYILLLVVILATKFLPFLSFLNEFPFVLSKQFYFGTGGKPMAFQLVTSAGSILFICAILGGLIQGATFKMLFNTLIQTLKQVKLTIITVLAIVALAKVMGYSGMVGSMANTIATVSGGFYPLMAPLLGALGTFVTGSDTSSNVLFGNLQKETALKLGMSPEWITAANASGATAGKMISPQSIAIAASATGLTNREGEMLGKTYKYCFLYVVILGILVFVFNR